MTGYTKLFSSIITSSIWTEDDQTRIVWITLLALADRHGEVAASIPGLARVAGVSVEACEKAIAKFMAPDPYSRTPDEEGRRIERIEGGWALVNHAKYRAAASEEDEREKAAIRQKRLRDKKKDKTDEGVTVTDSNAPSRSVTPSNAKSRQAEAEAEAKAESKTPYSPPAGDGQVDVKPKPKEPRQRDGLMDALALVECDDLTKFNRNEWSRIAKAKALLLESHPEASPDDVKRLRLAYIKAFPRASVTAMALVNNFSKLWASANPQAAKPTHKELLDNAIYG